MQQCMFLLYLHKYNVYASSGSPLKQKAFIVYVCIVCDVIRLWSLTLKCAEAFPAGFAQKYAGIDVYSDLTFVLLCVASSHCSAPSHNGLITAP